MRLRAARIISSRRRCSVAWRSSRLLLQPLVLALASACCAHSAEIRSCSLYRVIRSGSGGFDEGALADDDPACGAAAPPPADWEEAAAEGGGGGGWNRAGGCDGTD